MKLTVDASIAVKWFVAEPLVDEARTVLTRRVQRYAPELLLAECANTIWKKARRGDIPDAQPYRQELANLPDILTLYPDRDLIERATEIAFRIHHPVYDCLYLACAEATASSVCVLNGRLKQNLESPDYLPRFQGRSSELHFRNLPTETNPQCPPAKPRCLATTPSSCRGGWGLRQCRGREERKPRWRVSARAGR